MSYCGIGITGNTAYLRGQLAAASPDITTNAQLLVATGLDPLDKTFVGVEFVNEIPAVNSGVDLTLYIDKNGVAAYLEEDATEYTLVNGSFVDPMYDPRLKSLTIGELELTPAFDSAATAYTATTANAADAITVVTSSADATATILNGETAVTSGANATWADGKNTVTVTVICGPFKRVYTIEVTKAV
jgi:hypothetical protein